MQSHRAEPDLPADRSRRALPEGEGTKEVPKISEPMPSPVVASLADVNSLRVISDATREAIAKHEQLERDVDSVRVRLGEPLCAMQMDDEKPARLETDVKVLGRRVEAARLAVLESLENDRIALAERVTKQAAYHARIKMDARRQLEIHLKQLFEPLAAEKIFRQFGEYAITETRSRRLREALRDKEQDILSLRERYIRDSDIVLPIMVIGRTAA